MNEQRYILGFNQGYMLAKYLPDVLAKIVKGLGPSNDYLAGFFSGKEEYELEHTRTQLDELSQLRNRSKDQERNLEL